MSSLTVIKVREGKFVSLKCLEESLLELGLADYVNIIKNEQGVYQLSYEKRIDSIRANKVHNELSLSLKKIIEKVTPIYIEKMTIQELTKKGFRLKEKQKIGNEKKLYLEKDKSTGKNEKFVITIHQNNRITLDAINFNGRLCLNASKSLEKKLGTVLKRDLKPEATLQIRTKSKISERRYLRI